jgi:hypothetical protein
LKGIIILRKSYLLSLLLFVGCQVEKFETVLVSVRFDRKLPKVCSEKDTLRGTAHYYDPMENITRVDITANLRMMDLILQNQ